MSIGHSVGEILKNHVTLEVEGIDRMYLNAYVPQLQYERGVVGFFRSRDCPVASGAVMDPISRAFVASTERFVTTRGIPLVTFLKEQRKDDVAAAFLAAFRAQEGVLFVGKAQEKVSTFRTQKRRNPTTGKTYPWLYRSTAMVNQYYFYVVDEDFGPLFIKFSSYFPYTAKVCLNGHEYAKRQLAKQGIPFEALDNGILSCPEPGLVQGICDGLTAQKIETVFRKWLARLPHPFTSSDREQGYRYRLSILQAEFSLTQVFDRPQTGRVFFEEVIRENLDMGRPDQVQLIFARRITKCTPGRFRTRVITNGVIPSLHVDYKSSRIKQYHKEGRALRTETTINNTRDFGIGKQLSNLAALRQVGFSANRRLLDVQRLSHDCAIGEREFAQFHTPQQVRGQRVAAMRFGDPRLLALFAALVMLRLSPHGFTNCMLRRHLAQFEGREPDELKSGRISYDLRRLTLRGIVRRIPHTHRYEATGEGLRSALFFLKVYARVRRPGLSRTHIHTTPSTLRGALKPLDQALDDCCRRAGIAA